MPEEGPTDIQIPETEYSDPLELLSLSLLWNVPASTTHALSLGVSPNANLPDPRGTGNLWPPIRHAAYHGHLHILHILVQAGGTDPATPGDEAKELHHALTRESDALMFAAEFGHVECVRVLLESGACKGGVLGPTPWREEGMGPVFKAAQRAEFEVLEVLMSAIHWHQDDELYRKAAKQGLRKAMFGSAGDERIANAVEVILRYGDVDVNEEIRGSLPLRDAVDRGLFKVARLLVENGADWGMARVSDPAEWDEEEFRMVKDSIFRSSG
ncbi:MAG: hypothetical protein M1831_004799 [Alyxoria varia]|nr:MAG: hypothetical protein M1831_004799 [Alyxoria varia]